MLLRFANPDMLWGLLPVLFFALHMLFKSKKNLLLFSWRRFFISIAALSLCVFGLARPQGGSRITSQQGMKSNLFIAVDISKSMLARDISPSRIQFGVTFAQQLLSQLSGVKVALFPFTMDGYVQMPLTTDIFAASDMLTAINPSIITHQGTDLTHSLNTLLTRILQAEQLTEERGGDWTTPQVLLLSDGESHEPLDKAVLENYRKQGIPIFTVTLGTTAGAQIPIEMPGDTKTFFRNPATKMILSQAHPDNMRTIAVTTGGDYYEGRMEFLPKIRERLLRTMQLGKLTTTFRIESEFFPVLFAIAAILFFFDFCFGRWEFAIRSLAFLLFLTGSSVAFAEGSIEGERDATALYNKGLQTMEGGDFSAAAETFQQSVYMSHNKELQRKALYNMGNAFMKMGDPSQALQAYQQAYDTLSGNTNFDKESNKVISDNIVLAAKLEQQMKEQEQKQQGKSGESDDNEKKQGQGADPKGPKKYNAQPMSESMKQKVYDLVSSEERQGMQRIEEQRNRGSAANTSKPW